MFCGYRQVFVHPEPPGHFNCYILVIGICALPQAIHSITSVFFFFFSCLNYPVFSASQSNPALSLSSHPSCVSPFSRKLPLFFAPRSPLWHPFLDSAGAGNVWCPNDCLLRLGALPRCSSAKKVPALPPPPRRALPLDSPVPGSGHSSNRSRTQRTPPAFIIVGSSSSAEAQQRTSEVLGGEEHEN